MDDDFEFDKKDRNYKYILGYHFNRLKTWMSYSKAAIIALTILLFIMFCVIISQNNKLQTKVNHLDSLNRNFTSINDELNKTKIELNTKDQAAKDFKSQDDARKSIQKSIDARMKRDSDKLYEDKKKLEDQLNEINSLKEHRYATFKKYNDLHRTFDKTVQSLNKEIELIKIHMEKRKILLEKYNNYMISISNYNIKINDTQAKYPSQLISVSILLNTTTEYNMIENDKRMMEENEILLLSDFNIDKSLTIAKEGEKIVDPFNYHPKHNKDIEENKKEDNKHDVVNKESDKSSSESKDIKESSQSSSQEKKNYKINYSGPSISELQGSDVDDQPKASPEQKESEKKEVEQEVKQKTNEDIDVDLKDLMNKMNFDGIDKEEKTESPIYGSQLNKKEINQLKAEINKEYNDKDDNSNEEKQTDAPTKQDQVSQDLSSKKNKKEGIKPIGKSKVSAFDYLLEENSSIQRKELAKKQSAIEMMFAKNKKNKDNKESTKKINYQDFSKNDKSYQDTGSDDPFRREERKLNKNQNKFTNSQNKNDEVDINLNDSENKEIINSFENKERLIRERQKIIRDFDIGAFVNSEESFDWNWIHKKDSNFNGLLPAPFSYSNSPNSKSDKLVKFFSVKKNDFTFKLPTNIHQNIKLAFDRLRDRAKLLKKSANVIHDNQLMGRNIMEGDLNVIISKTKTINVPSYEDDESYDLEINSNLKTIFIKANTTTGVVRAVSTLFQLLIVCENKLQLENKCDDFLYLRPAQIKDRPRYKWRGLMIDIARTYHPIECILRAIDGMELVKLNVLHLHLSDDQGFRVESKTYPLLNKVDSLYLTQEQIFEIVGYASRRGIRVVPEFSMPGNSRAILKAYDFLSSKDPNSEKEGAFNPTSGIVYTWIDQFLDEIVQLFPDKYLHIGGEKVQEAWDTPLIKEWNEKQLQKNDFDTLQNFFERKVARIVDKKGKIAIGWENIVANTLPKSVIIQPTSPGIETIEIANKAGFNVVYSGDFYLDKFESSKSYYSSPFFDYESSKVMGGEALAYSDYIKPDGLDMFLWPRLASLAEKLWSPKKSGQQDVLSMYQRQAYLSHLLSVSGVKHKSQKFEKIDKFVGKFFAEIKNSTFKSLLAQNLYVFSSSLVPLDPGKLGFGDQDVSARFDEFIDMMDAESYPIVLFNSLIDSLNGASKSGDKWWLKKNDPRVKWLVNQLSLWRDSSFFLSDAFANVEGLSDAITSINFVKDITTYGLNIFRSDVDLMSYYEDLFNLGTNDYSYVSPSFVQSLILLLDKLK